MLQSDPNAQATEAKDWKVVVGEHFPGLVPPVAACIATACSLILSDLSNCPALVLVGQPSSSKTTILEFIDPSFVYLSDNFTPRVFVTHAANIKKADLEKIDLLPRLKHKLWMVKDLAPIFSKRLDDLTETVGMLTRILDGRGYQSDSGAQGQRATEATTDLASWPLLLRWIPGYGKSCPGWGLDSFSCTSTLGSNQRRIS